MTTVPFTAAKTRAAVLAAATLAACGGSAATHDAPLAPPGTPNLGMPLRTAVAQLVAVGFPGTTAAAPALHAHDWGVVVLDATNTQAPLQARALVKALRAGAHPAPLVLAADPGHFPGAQLAPEPQQTGVGTAFRQARGAARVLGAAGVGAALAPDADLATAAGPANDRAFSDSAPDAARLTAAAERGWRAGGVAPVVGRFPGEGGASQDPENGPATVGLSLSDLRGADIKPFTAVAQDVPAVQLSNALYAAWDGVTPASLLPDAYRELRRTGFQGAAMTGDLTAATAATGGSVGEAAVDALRAGADLVYVPGDAGNQADAYDAVLAAASSGRIPRARLADALLHVAELKRSWPRPPA